VTDIFLSYANEDAVRAEQLAVALTQHGWKVWWDRKIPAGRVFEEVIEEAIDAAQCVLVLWSHASVKSRWVKSEASEGANRQILVPVLLDDSRIPLSFRQIQTAKIKDWNGEIDFVQIAELVDSIQHVIDRAGSSGNGKVVSIKPRVISLNTIEQGEKDAKEFDAVIIEQDTALVLNFSDEIRYPTESLESLTKKILKRGQPEQGSVLELATVPPQLLAIVHNLDNEPSWTEDFVLMTLNCLLKISAKRRFRRIVMPLLGTVHGNLPASRARELLDAAISSERSPSLRTIFLLDS